MNDTNNTNQNGNMNQNNVNSINQTDNINPNNVNNVNQNNNMIQNSINGVDENTNQSSNLNSDNTNQYIPPISDIKIDSSLNDTNTTNNNTSNSKLSTILLIILFIFLFAFVFGMPYIREFITNLKADSGLSKIEQEAIAEEKRQEALNKPTPTPEVIKTSSLTCIKTSVLPNYTLNESETFSYNESDEVLSNSKVYDYSFSVVNDDYNLLKNQCDVDSLKYASYAGYSMACSYSDVNIKISHEFDLELFKPITDGGTNILASASYKQNINTLKSTLESNGYTCE